MTQLVFTAAQSASTRLVFGAKTAAGGTPTEPPVNTSAWRPIALTAGAAQQNGAAATVSNTVALQTAAQDALAATARWQRARPLSAVVMHRTYTAEQQYISPLAQMQPAQGVAVGAELVWQSVRGTAAIASAWQQRGRSAGVSSQFRQQSGLPLSQVWAQQLQRGQTVLLVQQAQLARALSAAYGLMARLQDGTWLPAGESYHPPLPPAPPCYTPPAGDAVRLLFTDPAPADARLVFRCRGRRAPAWPQPLLVIPILRSYIMLNNVTMRRAHDNTELPLLGFGMRLDRESWTWSFTATLPGAARALVQDAAAPKPLRVTASVNGQNIELVIERVSRSQSFADDTLRVQGRGLSALLAAPYAPVRSHGNAADRTAIQLAAEVLTNNGVGIGWAVDWFLTDWLVLGGAWIQRGSYIDALNDIAVAVGGYVQPHDTAQRVQLLPAYPTAPWDWASATPDIELPIDATELVETAWMVQPDYNRIFVSGVGAGRLGRVTRQGTAGEKLMPMVTHPLITADAAVRQRGLAELGSMGRKTLRTLRLPVFSSTGIIKPGKLLRYTDEAGAVHTGISRAVSIDANNMPVLTQTLDVEFHGGF